MTVGNIASGTLIWPTDEWQVTAYTGNEIDIQWPNFDLTVDATGDAHNLASGDVIFDDWTVSGELLNETLLDGSIEDLIELTVTAEAFGGYLYEGIIKLLDLRVVAEANSGNIVTGDITLFDLNIDAHAFSGYAAEGAVVLFDLNVNASAFPGYLADASVILFDMVVSANAFSGYAADGAITLFDMVVTASAFSGYAADGSLILPDLNVNGTVLPGNIITGDLVFPEFNINGVVNAGTILTGAIVLDDIFSITGLCYPGELVEGSLNLDDIFNIEGSLISDSYLTCSLIWPEIFVQGLLRVESEATEFTCLAMNITNKAISRYTNYPFTGFAYFNGKFYATDGSTGIFELTGDTDNDATITGFIRFRLEDMDASGIKHRIREVWVTGKVVDNIVLALEEEGGRSIPLQKVRTIKTGNVYEIRYKAPKGLKGRFYALTASGTDLFDINTIRLFDEGIPERVR